MKIGFVGLGRLGFPCALAVAMKGHDVMAYDIVPALMNKDPVPIAKPVPTARNRSIHILHAAISVLGR